MKRRWILAFAVAVLAGTASAGDPPKVELPLGPYVRPGRPLDVRVVGGADRVRAPGTPWALPQGDRGDEFILQLTDATVGVLQLDVERSGVVERVTQTVETLPADTVVVGVRGDGDVPAGARALRLPAEGLPTVDDGWLLVDETVGVEQAPEWTVGPNREKSRGLFRPLLLPADLRLFEGTRQAAARAPRLPRDVAMLLLLCAAAEVLLLVVLAFRRVGAWRRAAWLAAPAVASGAFLLGGDRLPGALRAEATAIHAAQYQTSLILVRVDARRSGRATFDLPRAATSAAVLRYSADDVTVESVSAGRRVEMDVPAGQTRLFAYAVPALWTTDRSIGDRLFLTSDETSIPAPLNEWMGSMGFKEYVDGIGWYGFDADELPRGHGTTVVAGLFAIAEGPAR